MAARTRPFKNKNLLVIHCRCQQSPTGLEDQALQRVLATFDRNETLESMEAVSTLIKAGMGRLGQCLPAELASMICLLTSKLEDTSMNMYNNKPGQVDLGKALLANDKTRLARRRPSRLKTYR